MKARLYDKYIKPSGTIEIFGDGSIRLQFSQYNPKLILKFRDCVNNFLRKNNLKIVSNEGSSTKHNSHEKYNKKRNGFDIFVKYRNSKTGKIKLREISG